MLPPALTGRFHVFLQADSGDQVLEYGNRADALGEKPGVLDVMPVAYADLVVSNVTVPAQTHGGEPLTVNWTVLNPGLGTTTVGNGNDTIYLATNPDGSGAIADTQTTVNHLGFVGVGGRYQGTDTLLEPNGLSGNIYVVVTTARRKLRHHFDLRVTHAPMRTDVPPRRRERVCRLSVHGAAARARA